MSDLLLMEEFIDRYVHGHPSCSDEMNPHQTVWESQASL